MTASTITPPLTDIHDELCPDHELALELHRRAKGESSNDDLPDLLDDWHEYIFKGTFTACDQCEGEPPVKLEFHCNRDEQLTGFVPWPILGFLLANQIDRVREEPDDYEPEPVDGTDEERAAWYRDLVEIAFENESSDQQDWYFVLRVAVGESESSSFVRSRELIHGSTVVSLRPFTTLEAAIAHRAMLGTDDLNALTYDQLRSLAEEARNAQAE